MQEDAVSATIAVLTEFSRELAREDAIPLGVATAAVRKAENRIEFLNRVRRETGIPLYVISGEAEAYFDFQGVLAELPQLTDCLICDTGGGSTELILCKNHAMSGKVSLSMGAMSLTERYGQRVLEGETELTAQLNGLPFLQEAMGLPLVGIGGSVCALFGLDHPREGASLNGYTFTPERVADLFAMLYSMKPADRIALGVESGRADTVCAGLFPALLLLRKLQMPFLTLSTGGLREGIMAELEKENPEFYVQNPKEFFEKYLDSKGILW